MGTENVMKMQQELTEGEEGKAHYIPVETIFPFFFHYAYLDTEEYLADGLFGHKDYETACRALQRMLNSSEKRDLNDENDAAQQAE